MTFLIRACLSLVFMFGLAARLEAQEIILWHSMDGALAEIFQSFVTHFNEKPEQVTKNIKIIPQYKGTYEHTLNAGLKVLNTKDAPHILQVYEMGNLVMQAHPESFVPLSQLTSHPSKQLVPEHFLPVIREFYKSRTQTQGLPSLPFSASSVILFYNKDAFRKAGLDPEHPPTTWEEFELMAQTLKKAGAPSVLASGWLSGHHIDQTGAWHNQLVATLGNGVDGNSAVLKVNQPFFQYHLGKLAKWYEQGIFSLETGFQAEKAFVDGNIIILTQSANRLPNLEKHIAHTFDIGVGYFPYWKNQVSTYQNTSAGGGSFWALKGHKTEDYEAVQAFFEYLTDPKTQAEWHQKTCYMPVVVGAEAIAEEQKFYSSGLKGAAAKIALNSFSSHAPREHSRGVLLPNFPFVREVMIHEMKEAIRGNKSVEEALMQIDQQGNQLMRSTETH